MATNRDAEEAARKWAQSQGLRMDDPRVQRYIKSGGGHNQDISIDDIDVDQFDVDFIAGQQYSDDNRGQAWDSNDSRFKEAVANYAASQGLDVDNARVQKYARGLRSRTGDFGGREQDTQVGQRKTH